MNPEVRLRSAPTTPRSAAIVKDELLNVNKEKRKQLSSLFSPHLEKIPHSYVATSKGPRAFREDARAVARLLIEAYAEEKDRTARAARLARRVLEMLEYELESPRSDCFIDAASTGQFPHVRKMINNGQPLDARHSVTGYAAIHAASDFGNVKMVKFLLREGADLHCLRKTDEGTALHCAAENGHADLVRYLVQDAGIDKTRKNKFGLTAFDFAHVNGHDLITNILREPPARVERVWSGEDMILTSRSIELAWTIPDDNAVDLEEFEVAFCAVKGHEVDVFPERKDLVCTALVDAAQFGPNPHREWRDRERATRLAQTLENNTNQSDDEWDDFEMEEEIRAASAKSKTRSSKPAMYTFEEMLMPSTMYAATIRARSAAGWSLPSKRITFTTLPDVPDVTGPVRLDESGATCGSLDAAWEPPVSNGGRTVERYELQIRKAKSESAEWRTVSDSIPGNVSYLVNEGSGNVRITEQIALVQYTVRNLESGTPYQLRVKSVNSIGSSEFSPLGDDLCTRPATVATFVGPKCLVIDWADSVDIALSRKAIRWWQVQRTVPPSAILTGPDGRPRVVEDEFTAPVREYEWKDARWAPFVKAQGSRRSYELTNLCPGTMYYVRVRPVFKDESEQPPPWDTCAVSLGLVTSDDVPEPPPAPTVRNVNVYDETATVTHESVRLGWIAPRGNGSDVTAFSIRFTKAAIGTWQTAAPAVIPWTSEDQVLEHVVKGLDPGCGYKFSVRALNKTGWGPYSSTGDIVRTRPTRPPTMPVMTSCLDSFIWIEWQHITQRAEDYEFEVHICPATSENDWQPVQPESICQTNTVLATELQPVTQYYFRVRARLRNSETWTNFGEPGGPFQTTRRH
mmetsp:Transcript_9864/g.18169  ORF Transcript_9864/g.18169 Transcript_9864/m.18169 type:complete len:857 (-) Transcript_9864:1451-4021(-)